MTELLEQALSEVRKLPEAEQDTIATIILNELADEKLWDEKFAKSQAQLSRLAAQAKQSVEQGRVQTAGFDEL